MRTVDSFPELLLITDGHPCANGGGISQTLYNLLEGYPGRMYVLTRNDEPERSKDNPSLPAEVIRYSTGNLHSRNNRIFRKLNPWFERKYFTWQERNASKISHLPDPSNCLILVSTTVPHKLHLAWILCRKAGFRAVPFFMDDWLAVNSTEWRRGNINMVAGELLAQATGRIFISEQLASILTRRYNLPACPTLITHNPAVKKPFKPMPDPAPRTIIYAGSVWAMHLDALVAVSLAIESLRAKGAVEFSLEIYGSSDMWERIQSRLRNDGTKYCGYVSYQFIHSRLSEAGLLLCTASFDPAFAPFSQSSVQTKLTDYLAASRPVLFVGPHQSASGLFVEENQCGFCCYDPSPANIGATILSCFESQPVLGLMAEHAHQLAIGKFSKPNAQRRLYQFLQALALNGPGIMLDKMN